MKSVLCIDDSQTIRTSLEVFISEFGYEVTTAKGSLEAFEILQNVEKLPNLIFLDIMMPEQDGISVLKKLKANPKFQYIPVCILSTVNEHEKIDEGVALGACSWLIKPCEPEDIKRILSRYAG